jgi:regulator of replication initiation timing
MQSSKEKDDMKAALAQSRDENNRLVMEKNQLKAQMTELNG